jgi:hypothetical protein
MMMSGPQMAHKLTGTGSCIPADDSQGLSVRSIPFIAFRLSTLKAQTEIDDLMKVVNSPQ